LLNYNKLHTDITANWWRNISFCTVTNFTSI